MERREKTLCYPLDFFLTILRDSSESFTKEIPEDAEIIDVAYNRMCGEIDITLRSKSFPKVEWGYQLRREGVVYFSGKRGSLTSKEK